MQKKLIALAIAGLGFTSVAFAQTNVTIYGVVDASVDLIDRGDTAVASSPRATNISSNSSRIGFKGSEDLGDGLKALFQIETAFNTDGTVAGNLNSRNTFVGLHSKTLGQLLAGQYDTPYKTSTRGLDVFGDQLADYRNLLGRGRSTFEARPANTVRYDSNDLAGFKFAVAYIAAAETAGTAAPGSNQKGTHWSANAGYAITPAWNVTAAYEQHKFGGAATGSMAPAGGALQGQTEKAWRVGTGYKSGPVRVALVYEKLNDDFSAPATFTTGSNEKNAWYLGGGYTFGSNEVKLSYSQVDDIDGLANSGAKQWAAGIDHALSKRTKVYALYVDLTNDSAASYGLVGAGGNTTGSANATAFGAGADPSAWQFGVKHTF